jgi:hypothetical protein
MNAFCQEENGLAPKFSKRAYTEGIGFSMKALVSAILICIAPPIQAQNQIRQNREGPADSLQASSFIDALIKIATRFEIPLAVEWVQSADTLRPVRLEPTETSAAAMLDAVLATHKGYSWQLENGILHVFERSLAGDSRNPLNVAVGTFPEVPVTVPYADNFLFETVREVARPTGLPGIADDVNRYSSELTFRIQAHNDSVREILNKIIVASKMKIWIATFPESQPLTRKGFLEVTPMFDSRYVKAYNQPFWIFLRWGDHPWKRLETPEP